jgi:hypothetical protein
VTPPLVVSIRTSSLRDALIWIQGGRGWLLDALTEQWVPLKDDAPGLGGRALTRAEVDAVMTRHGLPTATRGAA